MRTHRWFAAAALLALSATACQDFGGTAPLPSGTQDPKTYQTPDGAMQMYVGAVSLFQEEAVSVMLTGGLLTDELASPTIGDLPLLNTQLDPIARLDARLLPEQASGSTFDSRATPDYAALQRVRGQAMQAIHALAAYNPTAPVALRGRLYAIEGFAELYLADLFCSGIPLSTLDFNNDFTYKKGSSTSDVYQHAIVLFDSAITLGADSVAITTLATLGKARANVALGNLAAAAPLVTAIPTTFVASFPFNWNRQSTNAFLSVGFVADREGGTGQPYVSAEDPRLVTHSVGLSPFSRPMTVPDKYFVGAPADGDKVSPYPVTSGIEARLIEAEAALAAGNASWLTTLNALRTTCTTTVGCPSPAPAGDAGVEGLPPLSDPGTADARVTLLFQERAFWLYGTGVRQGDLRRLIRQYHRTQSAVYPTGAYDGAPRAFGSDVTVPIPPVERPNPLFTGCINREA